MSANNQYRTLWLSDIHLGSKDCKAEFLLHLLQNNQSDTIYLVGDIVDFWALKRRMFWPQSHNDVLNLLLTKAQEGTEIVYLPGNHDELMKPYANLLFGSVLIKPEHIHETVTGKKLLILHGDKFDQQVCFGKLHAQIGDVAYDLLLFLNRQCHNIRKRLGFSYWSLSSYLKGKVKKANEAIERYKHAAVEDAKKQGADGIICGHIHHPQLQFVKGTLYCNDGDWIENCTLLAETQNGDLQLLAWRDKENKTEIISQIRWGTTISQIDECAA